MSSKKNVGNVQITRKHLFKLALFLSFFCICCLSIIFYFQKKSLYESTCSLDGTYSDMNHILKSLSNWYNEYKTFPYPLGKDKILNKTETENLFSMLQGNRNIQFEYSPSGMIAQNVKGIIFLKKEKLKSIRRNYNSLYTNHLGSQLFFIIDGNMDGEIDISKHLKVAKSIKKHVYDAYLLIVLTDERTTKFNNSKPIVKEWQMK